MKFKKIFVIIFIEIKKGIIFMNRTIESYENRIKILAGKNPVANAAIISKLRRRIRKMQNKA